MVTKRQTEVICLIANGKCDKQIARDLEVSLSTVRKHRRNIYQKLNIRNTAELTIYAVKNELCVIPPFSNSQGNRCSVHLTNRESQIVNLASKGLTNKEIAKRLSVKYCTVRKHRENVYMKYGVSNLAQLTILAMSSRDHNLKLLGT